mmetsp:Transcript_14948/g.13129  ORF Transcript_14948/g.13129 Transcript_14948/m.13129 type:complete len:195 (+) Transcript_14948:201-785(+)
MLLIWKKMIPKADLQEATLFSKVSQQNNGSSKKILHEDGVFREEDYKNIEGDNEIPFVVSKEEQSPKDTKNKPEDYEIKTEEKKEKIESNIITLSLPEETKPRNSSVDKILARPEKRKMRIPASIKEKLRSTSREGSVIRKYSMERFRESPQGKATNSIDRLRQNLAKFKKNTIFKKGSESEKSVRSRDSKISK